MSLLTDTENLKGTYLLILRVEGCGMLYTNQKCFLDRVLTFDLTQLLSQSKSVGRSGQPLRRVEQGSRLELSDMSPELLDPPVFLLFLGERRLLRFGIGLFGALRLGRLARCRSSSE